MTAWFSFRRDTPAASVMIFNSEPWHAQHPLAAPALSGIEQTISPRTFSRDEVISPAVACRDIAASFISCSWQKPQSFGVWTVFIQAPSCM
jgi:hypothetical protein